MSLLSEALEPCVVLNKWTADDGYGGYSITWNEGAEFEAAITLDTSTMARVAESQETKNLYTVVTRKTMILEHNDVFKRLSDGKVFRVTSDGTDRKTPDSALLDMRVVTAQEFKLPSKE